MLSRLLTMSPLLSLSVLVPPDPPSLASFPGLSPPSSFCWVDLVKHLGIPLFLTLGSQHTASLCRSPTSHSSFLFLPSFLLSYKTIPHQHPPSLSPPGLCGLSCPHPLTALKASHPHPSLPHMACLLSDSGFPASPF